MLDVGAGIVVGWGGCCARMLEGSEGFSNVILCMLISSTYCRSTHGSYKGSQAHGSMGFDVRDNAADGTLRMWPFLVLNVDVEKIRLDKGRGQARLCQW